MAKNSPYSVFSSQGYRYMPWALKTPYRPFTAVSGAYMDVSRKTTESDNKSTRKTVYARKRPKTARTAFFLLRGIGICLER